jgi:hypothetical protein
MGFYPKLCYTLVSSFLYYFMLSKDLVWRDYSRDLLICHNLIRYTYMYLLSICQFEAFFLSLDIFISLSLWYDDDDNSQSLSHSLFGPTFKIKLLINFKIIAWFMNSFLFTYMFAIIGNFQSYIFLCRGRRKLETFSLYERNASMKYHTFT